jgi:Domain of unknown function (DUF4291)
VKHVDFHKLLGTAILAHEKTDEAIIKVQWDPERGPKLERLPYRSIQIGLPGIYSQKWAEEWVHSIEDVTEMARALKKAIDHNPEVTEKELREKGLLPSERPYDEMLSQDIMARLGMLEPTFTR